MTGLENLSGGVNIASDTSATTTELQVVDYSAGDGRCGYYDPSSFIDVVALNNSYFSTASTNNRRALHAS